jgi:hypothetical protein
VSAQGKKIKIRRKHRPLFETKYKPMKQLIFFYLNSNKVNTKNILKWIMFEKRGRVECDRERFTSSGP